MAERLWPRRARRARKARRATVVCISNFTPRPGKKMSAVVGWVNVKDWSIPHLKALTVTFKLM